MAGPFYVDLDSPGSWQSRDGTNSASPWLGITGLQKAFDTVDANEICYVCGEGDLSKFYSLPYDGEEGGHLTDGEVVSWDSGEWTDGSTGTGVVHWTGADMATPIELELLTGTIPVDDDELKGATSGNFITVNGSCTMKGLDVDTKTGSNTTGYIKFIGTDASWNVVGGTTRAVVDFNEHANSDHCIEFSATPIMYWFQNFEAKATAGTSKDGWRWNTSGPSGFFMINCAASACSGYGFLTTYCGSTTFIQCVAYNNTNGAFGTPAGTRYFFCNAYGNSTNGWNCAGNISPLIGCISHGNTGVGFGNVSSSQFFFNCVMDGNTTGGIAMTAFSGHAYPVIIGCRITNHSGAGDYGINMNSATATEPTIVGWCCFDSNTDDIYDHTATTFFQFVPNADGTTTNVSNNENAGGGGETNQGYADAVANHNFATGYVSATEPDLRRVAITIPWT